jgi:hypothetical protein
MSSSCTLVNHVFMFHCVLSEIQSNLWNSFRFLPKVISSWAYPSSIVPSSLSPWRRESQLSLTLANWESMDCLLHSLLQTQKMRHHRPGARVPMLSHAPCRHYEQVIGVGGGELWVIINICVVFSFLRCRRFRGDGELMRVVASGWTSFCSLEGARGDL